MLNAPLDQFADRLIRNGEVEKFIAGLMERGVTREQIQDAIDRPFSANFRRTLPDVEERGIFGQRFGPCLNTLRNAGGRSDDCREQLASPRHTRG